MKNPWAMSGALLLAAWAASLAAGEAKKKRQDKEEAPPPFAEIAPRYREKIAAQEKALQEAKDDKNRRAAADALGWAIADYLHEALDAEYERWQQANKGKAGGDAASSPAKERDDLCKRLEELYTPDTTFIHVPHPFYVGSPLAKSEIRTAEYFATNKKIDRRDLLKKACCRRTWGGLGYGELRKLRYQKEKGCFDLFFETDQSVVTTFYLQSPADQKATLAIYLADKDDIVEMAAVNNQVVIGAAAEGEAPRPAKINKTAGGGVSATAAIALRKGLNLVLVMTRNLASQRHDLGFKVEGRGLCVVSREANAE
ncbi:MAG: hypothetical protein N3A66_03105 [Planctomycetota bacterium]|nr:hypothetical protein [Planctomycetota bacterium]